MVVLNALPAMHGPMHYWSTGGKAGEGPHRVMTKKRTTVEGNLVGYIGQGGKRDRMG